MALITLSKPTRLVFQRGLGPGQWPGLGPGQWLELWLFWARSMARVARGPMASIRARVMARVWARPMAKGNC